MQKTVHLAPPEPPRLKCPECSIDDPSPNRRHLTLLRSFSEQWGYVVTRHDVYRCRYCRTKFVSTNGREPEIAADWV